MDGRIRPGDLLSAKDYRNIREVYNKVYNHAPDNKEYTKVFLRAWLAHRDGFKVNWASYYFDTNRVQLRRLDRPTSKVVKDNSGQEVRCNLKPNDALHNDSVGKYLKEANMDSLKIQFLETQVSWVDLILQAAMDENLAEGPKMTMFEKRKDDLESQAQSLECAMQERRKSQLREEEEKRALEEKRQLFKTSMESEIASSVTEDLGDLKGIDEVTTTAADELRKIERLCEFQDYHLQRECQKVAELSKEQALVKEELTRVLTKYNGMHFKFLQLKSWMQILQDQMDRMAEHKGIIAIPLPIVNPLEVSEGFLYITKCPVCGYGFRCRNIVVGECSCTYQYFCAIVHFGPGIRSCASPICSKIYSDDWHESFGALSLSITFKDTKLDKKISSSTTFARRSSAGSLSTNCKCSCKFY